ncbi:neurofilament medium polypeptide [Penaeus vannamei]|uniref:neurofilament medium polypeptide n=1 Tax=Penaeus vannamei TaxID=6689 RepID=UPI00387F7CF5
MYPFFNSSKFMSSWSHSQTIWLELKINLHRTPSDLQTTKCTGSLKISHDRERKNERAAARSAHEPKLAHSVSEDTPQYPTTKPVTRTATSATCQHHLQEAEILIARVNLAGKGLSAQDQAILELKEDIKNTPRPVLARRQPESLDLLCPEDASKVDGKVAQIECLHAVLLEQRRLVEVERHYFAIFAGLATATLAAVAALIFLNRKLKQASLETRLVTLQDEKKPEIAEAQEDEESEEAEALEDEESEVSESQEDEESEVSESQEDEESEVSESQEDEESEVSESQEDEESEEAEALEDEESEEAEALEDEESEVSESLEDEESEEAEALEDEESEEAESQEDEESEEAEALEDEESEVSESQEDEESEVSESQEDEESQVAESQEDEESQVAESQEDEESQVAEAQEEEPELAHSVSDQRTNSASSRESRATCLQAAPSVSD